ncbi:hypothetical protein BA20089_00190 [Bifidobacterium asteroides DSM 20089]|uniref:Uncharacterized protein n=1 Tax=Bifidobacterium asteroides DSM 20089 TaxID=1437594 RepID=A0AAD0EW01_9BIFI|nr:hypothetical protein BA20089_00190 [Bifidobacterium asteroides DSM 20089]
MWMLCVSAMDGLQYRWLADGSADLVVEWLAFSDELFSPEKWHGFMDPKDIDPDSEECLASFSLITGGGGAVGSGPAASTRRPLRSNSGHRGCPPAGEQQMAAGEKSAMNMKEMKESISMGQEGKFIFPSDFI